MPFRCSRRSFLTAATAAALPPLQSSAFFDPPHVTRPRATDGDDRFEPKWDDRLTLTVSNTKGDLVGNDDKVIQAALDYVARLGGGTVHVLPGLFTLRNSIVLPSKTRLLGSGKESVLSKAASKTVALAEDSDWYDQEITLKDPSGFQIGDGVVLKTKNPHTGATDVIKRTLVAKSGPRFKLSDGIRKNLWLSGSPTCSTLFPLLTAENAHDVVIENITLDGNKSQNTNLNGNYGGGVFLQDCNRFTLRKVESRNYNGDGISFQICHDVLVDSCDCHDNGNLGIHPGSGSQRPIIRNCRLSQNDLGLFWCWGVKFGLAEGNQITRNRRFGISIGHNDTDNIMRHNTIEDSGEVGILFRNDTRGRDFWANRNLIEKNRIVNSGTAQGIAIDIQGQTKDVRIVDNELIESRMPENRIGIRIGTEAQRIELLNNTTRGFANAIVDLRGE